MAAYVYSTRFCYAWDPAAPGVFDVPAAHRAVVKYVSAASFGVAAGTAQLVVAGLYVWRAGIPVSTGVAVATMLVANAGERIELHITGDSVRAMCCGYLFRDVAASSSEDRWVPIDDATPAPPGDRLVQKGTST